jgi:hypothetical protein
MAPASSLGNFSRTNPATFWQSEQGYKPGSRFQAAANKQTGVAEAMSLSSSVIRDREVQTVACNACGSLETTPFFCLAGLPVHVGNFYDDAESARSTPRGNVELAYCHECSHVFNQAFCADLIHYRPGYEVALHHSTVFRNFMLSVAERLRDKYQLHGKRIVEIGAGDAWFLELLCRLGGNNGIGIDPTIGRPGCYEQNGIRLELIQDRFDRRFQNRFEEWLPDFVCCLSVLEHIAKPQVLVQDLRSMVGSRKVAIYFEIFNALRAFQRQEIWSIHYEQCSYFSERSFRQLFTSSGFQVLEGGGCYGEDQYLYIDCVPDLAHASVNGACQCRRPKADRNDLQTADGLKKLPSEISQFTLYYRQRCEMWRERFEEYQRQGKRVVFWGTGGKGVTFLNTCPSASVIEIAAEINPAKQGKFVPGSAQKIVAPEDLVNYQPDVIIVSNALYELEIREQATGLGLRSEIYVA